MIAYRQLILSIAFVIATLFGGCSCDSVNLDPLVEVSADAGKAKAETGESVVLLGTATDPVSKEANEDLTEIEYLWTVAPAGPEIASDTSRETSFISQVPGEFVFTLTVTDAGRPVTATTTVTIVESDDNIVTYLADPGGSISGVKTQKVADGKNGTEVTAVPDSGYEFVEWSDGQTEPNRVAIDVTSDLTVTARFKEIDLTGIPQPIITLDPERIPVASNQAVIPIRVAFTVNVGGFDNLATDVHVTGSALGVSVSGLVRESAMIYKFNLLPVPDIEGDIVITIPAGAASALSDEKSIVGTLTVTYDTTPPGNPVINAAPVDGKLTGTSDEDTDTIEVFRDGASVAADIQVDESGTWEYVFSEAGDYTAVAYDAAGNASAASNVVTVAAP